MRVLAFDTSTEYLSLALLLDDQVLAREHHAIQQHSELILPQLHALLGEAGVTLRQLDGIAFGAGPGAFTGLRIACAVAQGLAFGADRPVAGISTLRALAEQTGHDKVVACLDARMGEVYHAAYRREEGAWHEIHAPGLYSPQDIPLMAGEGWVGAGSGFAVSGAALQARLGSALCALQAELVPHAREIAQLAAIEFAHGRGVPAWEAAPIYIRDKVALKTSER